MRSYVPLLPTCAFIFCGALNAEDPTAHQAPYSATIRINLTKDRAIRVGAFEKSNLDRNIYFRSYYPPGTFSAERNREFAEIGAVPGRGILVFRSPIAATAAKPSE
jgi:hypothetical protein